MSFFRKILITLWRVWFYILIALPIIVMFPFLLLFTSKEKYYPQFFFLARVWAKIILYGMGFYPIVKKLETPQKGKSYMFVANHTSMTDIMLMLSIVKNPFVFVGKKELAKFPMFGFFYKRTCILVDRGNVKSRQEVFQQAQRRLNQGVSICIFPEGGVPDDESRTGRRAARLPGVCPRGRRGRARADHADPAREPGQPQPGLSP